MEIRIVDDKDQSPVPRYTSYPTVPFWKDGIDVDAWKDVFYERVKTCNRGEGISLYIHLPFCESLCIYCGCNKRVSANHYVETVYLEAILKEWAIYRDLMDRPPLIRELHLGGGTPTFFSAANLDRLISGVLEGCHIHRDHNFSIEGHPNNTTREQLDVLYRLGFRRISYGVQDLDPEVQALIHRKQSFEQLRLATVMAREAGFTGINFDLVYGLPRQYVHRLEETIRQSLSLRPDRIAFYSYAHMPQINAAQRLIETADLPTAEEKQALYQRGKDLLEANGYHHIGMDHFSLPYDGLYKAWREVKLHRNFMGYTTQRSGMLLGLGVSAISDTGTAFAQNDKSLAGYYRTLSRGALPIRKGYFLSEEDRVFRRHILELSCKGRTTFDPAWSAVLKEWVLPRLRELEADGLVKLEMGSSRSGQGIAGVGAEGGLALKDVAKGKMTTDATTMSNAVAGSGVVEGLVVSGVKLEAVGWDFLRYCCKAFDLQLLRKEANI